MRFITTLFLLLSFGALQAEEDDPAATEAMRAGNYAIAYSIWQPKAQAGDADAQYNIGWLYHNGYGLAINDKQASFWWQQATAQGHIDARFALAALYTHGGRGVQKDIDKAIPLYIDSLGNDDEDARLVLLNLLLANNKTSRLLATSLKPADWQQLGAVREVKSKLANIRSEATLNSKTLHVLEQGASLLWVSNKDRWIQIVVMRTGQGGWIHDSLLVSTSP